MLDLVLSALSGRWVLKNVGYGEKNNYIVWNSWSISLLVTIQSVGKEMYSRKCIVH